MDVSALCCLAVEERDVLVWPFEEDMLGCQNCWCFGGVKSFK